MTKTSSKRQIADQSDSKENKKSTDAKTESDPSSGNTNFEEQGSSSDEDAPPGKSTKSQQGHGYNAGNKANMDVAGTEEDSKYQRIWRQSKWWILGGLCGLVLVISVLLVFFVYNLHISNTELTSRIKVLERKILIDKDIDKLQRDVEELERRSAGLKPTVDTMEETVAKLKPDVENLDKTFQELKPKVEEVDKTMATLGPKVEELSNAVVKWEPDIKKIDETVAKLKPVVEHLDELVISLEPKVTSLDQTVATLEPKVGRMDETVGKLEPKVENLDRVVVQLEPKVKKLDDVMVILEPKVEKIDQIVVKLEPKVEKLDNSLVKLEPIVKKLDGIVVKLEPKVEKLDGIVVQLEPKVKQLEEEFSKVGPKVQKLVETADRLEPKVEKMDDIVVKLEPKVEKLDERVEKLDIAVSGTEKLRDDVRELQGRFRNLELYCWEKLPESINRLDNQELASRSQTSYIYILIAVIVCLIVWLVSNYSQMAGKGNASVNQQQDIPTNSGGQTPPVHQELYRPERSVLDSIQRTTLARQICVISFYSETKAFHMRLVESACSGELTTVDRVSSLVSNHETIPNLPRAKIFLVFVDFNERDIILEHPDREIGDLKMTTVQGARKMGGDVFVVYVKDKGSRNLDPGHLYNERLRSITTHPELSVLSRNQHVLTTFEEFTLFQRDHLTKSFIKTLQR